MLLFFSFNYHRFNQLVYFVQEYIESKLHIAKCPVYSAEVSLNWNQKKDDGTILKQFENRSYFNTLVEGVLGRRTATLNK